MRAVRFLFAILVPISVSGQDRKVDHNAHGWYSYFGDHPIGDSKWGLHLEEQYRRHDVVQKWQQLLLRPGVNYQISRNLTLTVGYAYAHTFTYGDFTTSTGSFPEHRLWQQGWWRYSLGRLSLGTRIRFEERFIGSAAPGQGFRHENRLRTMQHVTKPLTGSTYLTAYNELWFYVKPYVSNSAFDQNRAYGAVGFNLKPSWRLEIGYMNQALLRRSGSVLESNHTLMLSVYSTAPFRP